MTMYADEFHAYELLKQRCVDLEHYVTPEWAAHAIVKKEFDNAFINMVVDPCCGAGVLTHVSRKHGFFTRPFDIFKWGNSRIVGFKKQDFLKRTQRFEPGTLVFMNPPFSLAVEFVEKAIELGADKIVCFQRFAWYESSGRKEFWDKHIPEKVYVCGDRAECWRYDLPINERGKRYDPESGKELGSSPTAHAWFVWNMKKRVRETKLGRVYKKD